MKLRILLFIIVFSFIFGLLSFSDPVSLDNVIRVGKTHITLQRQSSTLAVNNFLGRYLILNIAEIKENEQILGYIVELDPEGFIAISSNTNIHPVIAYSFTGRFSMENSPDNVILQIIKMDLKSRLEAIPFTSSDLKEYNNRLWEIYLTQSDISSITYTQQWGPLLNTTWHQSHPYNKYCPIDPVTENRSVTGCNAIAYAQILNYWKYPRTLTFTNLDKYTTKTYGIKIDEDYQLRNFLSFSELNSKLSNIKYNGDEDEISALCFGCGVKVNSDYTSTGTSGWIGTYYYQDNFGYADGDFISGDAPGFYNTLTNNMKDSKPAHLSIAIKKEDGKYYDGHGIVADGYRDTGEYHLNFGWGPNLPDPILECWYFLPNGMPNNYNTVRYGMLNIYPGSITVLLKPKSGEKLRGGNNYDITWNNTAIGTHHIHLQYSVNGGINYNDIVSSTEDDGLYQWSTPLANSSSVRVRMIAENSSNGQIAMDESGNFMIDSTPPVTKPNLSGEQADPGSGWYTSDVTVTLSALDNLSGIDKTYYKINSGDQNIYQSPFNISGTTIYYYSEDAVGNIETEKSIEVKIDKSPPDVPVVTDDGEWTSNNTQLHATWTSSDTESDISEYMYSIGTTQGGFDVVPWTSTGSNNFVTKDGLNLVQGETYYFSVKAKNGARLWSNVGFSDGIIYMLAQININPKSFVFSAQPSSGNPNPQILSIKNPGYGTLNWSITENCDWLFCSPINGSCTDETDEVSISVDITGLDEGMYTASLVVSAEGASNSPQIINIFLRIFSLDKINLSSGWNLISIPIQPYDDSIDSVLYTIIGKYDSVWAYFDGGWKKYIVGMENFRDIHKIIPGRGYWVKMKENAMLDLTGDPIENLAIQLYAGWNLVGYNQKNEKLTEEALAGILQDYSSAWAYEQQSGWKKIISGSNTKDLLTMGPWKGYWFNMKSNCIWGTANPSPPLSVSEYKMVQNNMPEMPYVLWGNICSRDVDSELPIVILKVNGEVKSTAQIKSINNEIFYSIDVPIDANDSGIYINYGKFTEIIRNIPLGSSGQAIRFDLTAKELVKESKLYQNYPNPFNPETWIPYELKEDADVEIRIYNLAGQCIRLLKLGHKPAGVYKAKDDSAYWNGKNDLGEFVSSGIYFYSISAGGFNETRKMILLR